MQALCHLPGPGSIPTPKLFPFPARPAPASLPRTLQCEMRQNAQAAVAQIAPESVSAPSPHQPEPGLCSRLPPGTPGPFPSLFDPSHLGHLAHPVPVVRFWFRFRLGFWLQGRPSPAQGPRRPPGAHPLIPPPPPSPPHRLPAVAADTGAVLALGEGEEDVRDAGWLAAAGSG